MVHGFGFCIVFECAYFMNRDFLLEHKLFEISFMIRFCVSDPKSPFSFPTAQMYAIVKHMGASVLSGIKKNIDKPTGKKYNTKKCMKQNERAQAKNNNNDNQCTTYTSGKKPSKSGLHLILSLSFVHFSLGKTMSHVNDTGRKLMAKSSH